MGDDPEKWMKAPIRSWIAKTKPCRPEQLWGWLQGFGLPPVGDDEDPYRWLLYGLEAFDEPSIRVRFAARVRESMDRSPNLDVDPPGKRPKQLLYNLFKL